MQRILKRGCSYRDPNPTPEALKKAQARGEVPEIHLEAGDIVDLATLSEKTIAALEAGDAFEPELELQDVDTVSAHEPHEGE